MNSFDYQLDQHLRFKNVSKDLAKHFDMSVDDLEGSKLDTMVTQRCAPNFLEAALETFRGFSIKTLRIEIVQNKREKIDVEMSMHPQVHDTIAAVKGIRGKMRFLEQRVVC